MTWHLGRLAGFDTESTGVDTENDRIVTACVIQCGGTLPVQTANWLSDVDGMEIPKAASDIHKVTTERARTEGRPAAEVIEQVVAALVQVVLDGTPVVVMNASFDLTLLDREARRYGVQPLTEIVGKDLRVVDPRVLDKRVDPYRRGGRRLEDLCRTYGVRLDGAHSADADAIAACRVAWRIAQQHAEVGRAFLNELHEQQADWAREQAASLAAYFARTPGKEHLADTVRHEWPLIPYREVSGDDQ